MIPIYFYYNTLTEMAFIPNKTTTGNTTRGPNGDLDNDGLTNYEEYSYNMPEDYNLTKDGPERCAGAGRSKIP